MQKIAVTSYAESGCDYSIYVLEYNTPQNVSKGIFCQTVELYMTSCLWVEQPTLRASAGRSHPTAMA